ncbi:tail tape measure protein [Mesorhizobium marinum]|uniref:tail tape measure protein n=1 Tax=Mesorhizobium marinum TaxID=3228790 RepID=UPI0034673982
MAGLSNRAFQELGHVARSNRIDVDALTDGMKELQLRADEYIATGKGSAAESFERLGYKAEELRAKLADPSALFSEIMGKLGDLDKAAQIRIADELFGGTGGEKFVQLIAQGEGGIRATIQEAHNLGAVLSDEVIERAVELDRKFNAVASTVGSALKSAIVLAAAELTRFIDQFREFEDKATGTLKDRFAELQTRYGQLVKQQGTLEDQALGLIGKDAATELKAVQAEMDQIARELSQRATPMLREKLVEANTASTPYVPPASSSAGRSAATTAAEREAEAVRRLIAELEEELRLVGATDAEKRASAILRQAGAAATDEERQKLVALNEAVFQNEEAQSRAADQAAFFRETTASAFTSLIPTIKTGNAALDQFVNTLIRAVAQAALLGGGPLGALFGGGLFGFADGGAVSVRGFASGGHVSGPGTGTSDSILARVSDGEFIVRAQQARKHRALLEAVNAGKPIGIHRPANGRAGDTINLSTSVTVNANGGDEAANADLARQTARETREAVRSVIIEEILNQKRFGGVLSGR